LVAADQNGSRSRQRQDVEEFGFHAFPLVLRDRRCAGAIPRANQENASMSKEGVRFFRLFSGFQQRLAIKCK
jgi:hypothetical protein